MSQSKPCPCKMRGNSPGPRIDRTEKLRLTALSTSSSRKSSSLLTTRQRNLSGIGEAYTILATQTSPSQTPESYRTPPCEVIEYSQAFDAKLCAGYVRFASGASATAMLDSSFR